MTGAPPAPARAQLFFECADLDREVERLKAGGVVFRQDPTDMPYLWREARLSDPNGHDIGLCFAAENRLDPPWEVRPDR